MRFFNTAGPIVPADHYHIPPLERFDLDEILSLVRQKKYFVLYAPRQTGKTSSLLALRDELNGSGRYRCIYVNVEIGQSAREDVTAAMRAILGQLARAVSTGVKLPTYAGLKFPSLLTLASHCDLPNITPPRMLSVWFQSTEGTEVITWERLFMLHELHAQGVSISAIARQTGLDRKTVRRHLAAGIEPPVYGPRAPQGSRLDPYKAYLQTRLAEYPGLSGARLLREIKAQGYTGGYTILTDYLRTLRPPQETGYEVRFETPAGHQGQVDFAHFKVRFRQDPGTVRVVWLFSLVLGHSRYLFGRFVWRQTLDVLVACHEAAFAELGGVPARLLYDRMKTVVLGESEAGEVIYHPTLLALAAHYGFHPRACRPYRAKTKGKVERPFRYVRQDFFLAGQFDDLADLNGQFDDWRHEIANQRTHATTGRVVHDAFEAERPALQPLPAGPFPDVLSFERRVTQDGMVSIDGNLYSVPDTNRKRQVEVQRSATEIRIIEQGQCIARHPRLTGRGQRRLAPGHRQWRKAASAIPLPVLPSVLTRPGETVAARDLGVYQRIGEAKARETLA